LLFQTKLKPYKESLINNTNKVFIVVFTC